MTEPLGAAAKLGRCRGYSQTASHDDRQSLANANSVAIVDCAVTEHQLAYLLDVFGPDRILMGTDYPFDMGEYEPIGHVAALDLDDRTFSAVCEANARRALGLGRA